MKEFTVYDIIKDSQMASVGDLMGETEDRLVAELFDSIKPLDTNLHWIKPDEPTDECRFSYCDSYGIPVLIKRQYHRLTAGVKVSATIQEHWRKK